MIFRIKLEFRGKTQTKTKNGTIFDYLNLEDEMGESCKFRVNNNDLDFTKLVKGKKYFTDIDYNTKYGSLNVVGLEECKS